MNKYIKCFVHEPIFNEDLNGFVVLIRGLDPTFKTFSNFVFKDFSDAHAFASEYRETQEVNPHWNERCLGDVKVRRSTETDKPEGNYFSTLEEYKGRKIAYISFISKIHFYMNTWTVFDSLVDTKVISKVISIVDKFVVAHNEEFKKNLVNENKY
jgi:hypothetical protein